MVSDSELDAIIAELDQDYTGVLPEGALREAQRYSTEITPRLIDLIRKSIEKLRAGGEVKGDGALFAMYLLTEFRAKEALPVIVEALSLPDNELDQLFGDAVADALSRVLATMADDKPDVIDSLIADRSVNNYARWEAARTLLLLVRDGRMSRDEAVRRLHGHLRNALAQNDDWEYVTGLVCQLDSLAAREAIDDIEEAYRRNLVDESFVALEEVHKSIDRGAATIDEELESLPPSGIEDSVEELSAWASYSDEEKDLLGLQSDDDDEWTGWSDDDSDWDDEGELADVSELNNVVGPGEPSITIRHESPRVGRNDPCPCGSGKKFKKCCGKA